MICLNPKCGAVLTEYQWGEGYCSKGCMAACLDRGERISDMLHGPCGRVVAETADEVDAMIEAQGIDVRLPRIIFLRKHRVSLSLIGADYGISKQAVDGILHKLTPKLLRRCGLRKI